MTALQSKWPNFMDLTAALDPDGKVAVCGEVISQVNTILDDMPWFEGNLPTGHQSTIRTGYPAPTWRKLYGGVQPTKATRAKIVDTCGMLEDYSEVDKAEADLASDADAFLMDESTATLHGMSQELASSLFYANEATTPEKITGFAPRFNSLSAENGDNIIKSGTTPDTSIWLVGWGKNSVFGIYPKGSKAGFQINKKGQVTIEDVDGSGGRMEAYRTHFRWDSGLCVKDWRYVVRVQIDVSELTSDAATGPKLIDLFQQAVDLLPETTTIRPMFYASRTVRGYLRRQVMNKVASGTLTMEDIKRPNGQMQREPAIDGIPVRRVDALAVTETEVS